MNSCRIIVTLATLAAAVTICGCRGATPLPNALPNAPTSAVPDHRLPPNGGPAFVEIDGEQAISKIASDRAGGEWFEDAGALVRLDETTRGFARFKTASTAAGSPLAPNQAATSMWFAAPSLDRIGRIDLNTHTIHVAKLKTHTEPQGLAQGPGNSMWFTESGKERLARIDPDTHKVYGYSLGAAPYDVALGSDGKLWITTLGSKIMSFDPTTHKKTALSVGCQYETYITAGPSGTMWFICYYYGAHLVARLNIAYRSVGYFEVVGGAIDVVERGSEIWVTGSSSYGSYVAQYVPSADEFVPYYAPAGAKLAYLASGADGELWATDFGNKLWRICPDLSQQQCAQ
jgi:streptogramin lyase